MEKVAALSEGERRELFQETAAQRGMAPAIVEKDFWVCWVLKRLYEDAELSSLLMFKGGTSLSKVFHLIERFSEDIDLILDWRVIVQDDDPLEGRTKNKQQRLNQEINRAAQRYIAGELFTQISNVLSPICDCELDSDDGFVVNVRYPAAFSDEYLRPEVRLEIGPLALWVPYAAYPITPYAAESFPDVFEQQACNVNAIKAVRTFWEKATILHQETHRSSDKPQPPRYSRHYYDLAMMVKSDIKELALSDLAMLEDVVRFKMRFYPRGWARYDLAKPGTLRLVPDAYRLRELKKDYREMEAMIFGEYPSFEEVMDAIAQLEREINNMAVSGISN